MTTLVGLVLLITCANVANLLLARASADPGGSGDAGHVVRSQPADPAALGTAAVALIAIAVVATLWPARRAARVDPIIALRAE